MKKLVVGIVLTAAAAALALILINRPSNQQPDTGVRSAQVSNQPSIVEIDANGFEPQTLTIKQGNTVTFKNVDTEEHWPASDDHPAHQIYAEFDPKRSIRPNESWTFKFSRPGQWGFHDHLFPSFRGIIIVEP